MVDPIIRAVAREDLAIVSIATRRGTVDALATRARDALGVALPPPGRWEAADGLTFICTTPDQWLVLAAGNDGTLVSRLGDALGDAAMLIDLSGSRVAVSVAGPAARTLLAKALPIDLHPRAMRPGDAAATVAGHLPMLVYQHDDVPTYDLLCASSLTGSFHRWLTLSGVDIGEVPGHTA